MIPLIIRAVSGGKFVLFSKKKNPKTGKRRRLSKPASRKATAKRERQVNFFKHRNR